MLGGKPWTLEIGTIGVLVDDPLEGYEGVANKDIFGRGTVLAGWFPSASLIVARLA